MRRLFGITFFACLSLLLVIFVLLVLPADGQTLEAIVGQSPGGTVATPTFDHDTGSYAGSLDVTISDATGGATIIYCMAAGSDCSPVGGTTYTTPVHSTIDTAHLCAYATHSGMTDSATHCATYTIGSVNLAIVQVCPARQSYGTFLTCTFASNITSGNVLVISLYYDSHALVAPTGCVTWTEQANGTTHGHEAIYTGPVTSTAACTVTLSPGSKDTFAMDVWEVSHTNGLEATPVFEFNTTSADPSVGPSIVTTLDGDLVLTDTFWISGGPASTPAVNSPFTIAPLPCCITGVGMAYDLQATHASTHASWPNPNGSNWQQSILALKHN